MNRLKIVFRLLVPVLVALVVTCCTQPAAPTSAPTEPTVAPVIEPTPLAVASTDTPLAETPTPEPEAGIEEDLHLPEVPRITCEEVKRLMDEGADLVVVDARISFSYEESHLPGAISIPGTVLSPAEEEERDARLMQLPKDKLIVLYSD